MGYKVIDKVELKWTEEYFLLMGTHFKYLYMNFVPVFKLFFIYIYIYMLFTGWEVRIVKNCDRGLENAVLGLRPRAAFSSLPEPIRLQDLENFARSQAKKKINIYTFRFSK